MARPVISKMGGNNGQYDSTLSDVPQPEPIQGTPSVESSRAGDDGIRRVLVLEMVCAAVRLN